MSRILALAAMAMLTSCGHIAPALAQEPVWAAVLKSCTPEHRPSEYKITGQLRLAPYDCGVRVGTVRRPRSDFNRMQERMPKGDY